MARRHALGQLQLLEAAPGPLSEFILHEPHIARIINTLRQIGNRIRNRLLPGTRSSFLYIAWDFNALAWEKVGTDGPQVQR